MTWDNYLQLQAMAQSFSTRWCPGPLCQLCPDTRLLPESINSLVDSFVHTFTQEPKGKHTRAYTTQWQQDSDGLSILKILKESVARHCFMQFVHLYGIFYILLSLGAVDHHETLLSIKGVCSPKYIKTQMNVKYTLARFLNAQNPSGEEKHVRQSLLYLDMDQERGSSGPTKLVAVSNHPNGVGWGFWSDPVLLLSVMEQQETRLHVQLHQSGNEHGWGRSCRNLTQGKNDGEMTLHMGNKANS